MRIYYLILIGLLCLPACAPEPTVKNVEPESANTGEEIVSQPKSDEESPAAEKPTEPVAESATPVAEAKPQPPTKSEAELKAEALIAKLEAKEKRITDSKTKLNSLLAGLKKESAEWQTKLRNARSRRDRTELMKANPTKDYGKKLYDLYVDYKGTEAASTALENAVTQGSGPGKNSAAKEMLALAEKAKGSDFASNAYHTLTKHGMGDVQKSAMAALVALAEKNLNASETKDYLTSILKVRTESEPKSKAKELMMTVIDKDVRSNSAAELLTLMASNTEGKQKGEVLKRLVNHHIDSPNIRQVLNSMQRAFPAKETEDFIRELCERATGENKGHAMVAYAKFVALRDRYKTYYSTADEATIEAQA